MKCKEPMLSIVHLGILTLVPILGIVYYSHRLIHKHDRFVADFQFEVENQKLETGVEFEIKACKVIDGFRFDMYLEGGKRITAHLPHATKEEATPVVVDLMEKITPPSPTVILRRKTADAWIVDLYVTVDGKRSNISDLLRAKGLLL